MITCPNCGKEFDKKDQSFFGHISVCTRNLPDAVKADMLKKARTDDGTGPAVTPSTASPPPSEPSVQSGPAQPATFGYGTEPAVSVEPLDLGAQKQATGPAGPLKPGEQAPEKPPSPLVEEFRKLFQVFGDKWNEYLAAPVDQPDPSKFRWKQSDTELAVAALEAVDRKWGMGQLEDFGPYVLIIAFVADVAALVVGGLSAKGKLKLPGRKGVPEGGGFTPAEDKAAAEAWEAELKARETRGPQGPVGV